MSARSAARRYAAVLFEVVNTSGDVSRAERDLKAFVELVNGHDGFQPLKHTLTVQPGSSATFDLTADDIPVEPILCS